ncbi:MAG: hypothetical protein AAFR47_10145 [Pseudomonadota bacterium]
MIKFIPATALAVGLVALTVTGAAAQELPSPVDNDVNKITISCYRGWIRTIAWDRPNAVFVNDLVQLGYTYERAHAIGMRVCRDEYGLGESNFGYQRDTLLSILRTSPPS